MYLNMFLVMFSASVSLVMWPGAVVPCCMPGRAGLGAGTQSQLSQSTRLEQCIDFVAVRGSLCLSRCGQRRLRITGCCWICLCSSGFSVPAAHLHYSSMVKLHVVLCAAQFKAAQRAPTLKLHNKICSQVPAQLQIWCAAFTH